jgi:sugar/nucleoside kinase (ribokinase family)
VTAASSLLIVGSIAYDDLEMPSGSFPSVVGGAATYSSITASLFGGVQLVGIVGEDFDAKMLETMKARGIDISGVEHIKGGKTFRWKGRYASDLMSRETLDTQLNVFADFKPKLPPAFTKTPYVLLGNIHPALQVDVLTQMDKPKFVAADTMNFWISGEPKLLNDVLAKIDLLVINDEEARQLSGLHNLQDAAKEIRSRGPRRLIIKRAEYGSLLFDEAGIFNAPTAIVSSFLDPTGAGDSFAGGLMGYLAANDDGTPHALRRAMLYASAMGSFCVEKIGTNRILEVTKSEAEARAKTLAKTLDFGGKV